MEELLAYVGAELKKPEEEISDELVFLINSRIRPPKPVTKEDIFVRTMFLVSDEVNSYGGRFPLEELHSLANLVIDSPVMVGHTKEKLPIARNFKAEVVPRDGQSWVKVWFYWLKSSKDALSLKENIDHGIYKECSLGFVFEFPQCSICGEDMRKCRHIPFKSYQTEEGEEEAYFNYRNVIRVLETSLVYRGAVPNTSMSDELRIYQKQDPEKTCGDDGRSSDSKSGRIHKEVVQEALKRAGLADQARLVGGVQDKGYSDHDLDLVCSPHLEALVLRALPTSLRSRVHFVRDQAPRRPDVLPLDFIHPTKPKKSSSSSSEIFHLEDLVSLSGEFLVEPKYDGVRTQVHKKGSEVKLFTDEGHEIQQRLPRLVGEILQTSHESFILDGELVRYKGNSRLSYKGVASYVRGELDSSSSRSDNSYDDWQFKLKAFDLLYLNGEEKASLPLVERKKLLEGLFSETRFLQKVRWEKVRSSDLALRIKTLATSEGSMIKKADSGYFEEANWYHWKRHLELDVLVMNVDKNKGGSYNYTCAIGTRANPVLLGSTYSTFLKAEQGHIIRVRVDRVTKTDGRFTWHAPKVLDKRSDKKEPDPVSVLERMVEKRASTDHRPSTSLRTSPPSAAKNSEAADCGPPTADRFVLQLHWWGEAKHHDLRFQKGDLAFGLTIFELDPDALHRGRRFLCDWKEYHDPKWMDFEGEIPPQEEKAEGNPSKEQTAHMRMLDRGRCQVLERKADSSSFNIEGQILDGTYLVRKIRLKGQDRWLLWKRSTD